MNIQMQGGIDYFPEALATENYLVLMIQCTKQLSRNFTTINIKTANSTQTVFEFVHGKKLIKSEFAMRVRSSSEALVL